MQQDGDGSIIPPSESFVGSMIYRLFQAFLVTSAAIVALSACVYRMDIPQGNRVDPALVEQLEIGMSRKQVQFLLGTPAIVDLYHPDKWFYVYYLKNGEDGSVEKRVMTLTFSNDLLADIEGSINPG